VLIADDADRRNALTGINRILTIAANWRPVGHTCGRNALTGINRILTQCPPLSAEKIESRRNALTGINRILTGRDMVKVSIEVES